MKTTGFSPVKQFLISIMFQGVGSNKNALKMSHFWKIEFQSFSWAEQNGQYSQVINFFSVANGVDDNRIFIQGIDNPPVPDPDFVSPAQFPG